MLNKYDIDFVINLLYLIGGLCFVLGTLIRMALR